MHTISQYTDLLYEEAQGSEDVSQGAGGLIDLKEEEVGVEHLLHQQVLTLVLQ
jgi:hypothetical protein